MMMQSLTIAEVVIVMLLLSRILCGVYICRCVDLACAAHHVKKNMLLKRQQHQLKEEEHSSLFPTACFW